MTDPAEKPFLTSSVALPSYNRQEDLARTCEQLAELVPAPEAVIVVLDGCTDGSREMLESRFPFVVVVVNPRSRGSVVSRDVAFQMVTSDLIVSLDDDSYPMDKDFLARISDLFLANPEVGVMTFPAIHDNGKPEVPAMSPDSPARTVASYLSASAVIRRKVYGTDARYVDFFKHGYEEGDLSIQCYAAGYTVWFEPSLRIRHHLSTKGRNWMRVHHQKACNEVLSVFLRCPMPYLPFVLSFRIFRRLQYACKEGLEWVVREPDWWWQVICRLPACFRQRRPVSWKVYLQWLRLARSPVVRPYPDRANLIQPTEG